LIESWINEKFIQPLCHYYTLEATIVYGLLMAGAVFIIYNILKHYNVKIDKYFLISIAPFIIYGGWTRALRDHNLYEGWIFCSPPIYILIFLITIVWLTVSLKIQKSFKIDYYKTMLFIGSMFLLYNLMLTKIVNFEAVGIITGLMIFWIVGFGLLKKFYPKSISNVNIGIILAHLLDASSSFTSISFFGYCEQHILTGVLMGAYCNVSSLPEFLQLPFMPWTMFIIKIVVVWGVLHIIDTNSKDTEFNNFLKIIVLILGLALGVRDMLTVGMLVI
jgi:uncharacterized membrane protein